MQGKEQIVLETVYLLIYATGHLRKWWTWSDGASSQMPGLLRINRHAEVLTQTVDRQGPSADQLLGFEFEGIWLYHYRLDRVGQVLLQSGQRSRNFIFDSWGLEGQVAPGINTLDFPVK
jgi:hypothetical protein